jgi:hypothetical protein
MMSALGQYGEKIHKKVKNAVEIAAAEQQRLRLSKGLLHLAARMERPKAIGRTQSQSENRGRQALHAPVVGELRLDCDTWDSPEGGGQRLMVLTADPGTPSHDRLRVLASWAVTAHAVVGKPKLARGRVERRTAAGGARKTGRMV